MGQNKNYPIGHYPNKSSAWFTVHPAHIKSLKDILDELDANFAEHSKEKSKIKTQSEQRISNQLSKMATRIKNDPQIKPALNVIKLPHNVLCVTSEYPSTGKTGFELLFPTSLLQNEEDRAKITEAMQGLMEYILSLDDEKDLTYY